LGENRGRCAADVFISGEREREVKECAARESEYVFPIYVFPRSRAASRRSRSSRLQFNQHARARVTRHRSSLSIRARLPVPIPVSSSDHRSSRYFRSVSLRFAPLRVLLCSLCAILLSRISRSRAEKKGGEIITSLASKRALPNRRRPSFVVGRVSVIRTSSSVRVRDWTRARRRASVRASNAGRRDRYARSRLSIRSAIE